MYLWHLDCKEENPLAAKYLKTFRDGPRPIPLLLEVIALFRDPIAERTIQAITSTIPSRVPAVAILDTHSREMLRTLKNLASKGTFPWAEETLRALTAPNKALPSVLAALAMGAGLELRAEDTGPWAQLLSRAKELEGDCLAQLGLLAQRGVRAAQSDASQLLLEATHTLNRRGPEEWEVAHRVVAGLLAGGFQFAMDHILADGHSLEREPNDDLLKWALPHCFDVNTLAWLESSAIVGGKSEAITKRYLQLARLGDRHAMDLCLRRLEPLIKGKIRNAMRSKRFSDEYRRDVAQAVRLEIIDVIMKGTDHIETWKAFAGRVAYNTIQEIIIHPKNAITSPNGTPDIDTRSDDQAPNAETILTEVAAACERRDTFNDLLACIHPDLTPSEHEVLQEIVKHGEDYALIAKILNKSVVNVRVQWTRVQAQLYEQRIGRLILTYPTILSRHIQTLEQACNGDVKSLEKVRCLKVLADNSWQVSRTKAITQQNKSSIVDVKTFCLYSMLEQLVSTKLKAFPDARLQVIEGQLTRALAIKFQYWRALNWICIVDVLTDIETSNRLSEHKRLLRELMDRMKYDLPGELVN